MPRSNLHLSSRCLRNLVAFAAALVAIPAAAADDLSGSLEALRQADVRVATVAQRIAVRNVGRCGATVAPQTGIVLHGVAQYDPADRSEVARHFALGRYVGVMGVVPGGAAARAGLIADDQLVAVNGRALPVTAPDAAPSRIAVARAQQMLLEESLKGRLTLTILRGANRRDVAIAPEAGCASTVELLQNDKLNAWANGSTIMIGSRLLDACQADDDLALVIAHELAHNLGAHRGPRGSGVRPICLGTPCRDGCRRARGRDDGGGGL